MFVLVLRYLDAPSVWRSLWIHIFFEEFFQFPLKYPFAAAHLFPAAVWFLQKIYQLFDVRFCRTVVTPFGTDDVWFRFLEHSGSDSVEIEKWRESRVEYMGMAKFDRYTRWVWSDLTDVLSPLCFQKINHFFISSEVKPNSKKQRTAASMTRSTQRQDWWHGVKSHVCTTTTQNESK